MTFRSFLCFCLRLAFNGSVFIMASLSYSFTALCS